MDVRARGRCLAVIQRRGWSRKEEKTGQGDRAWECLEGWGMTPQAGALGAGLKEQDSVCVGP